MNSSPSRAPSQKCIKEHSLSKFEKSSKFQGCQNKYERAMMRSNYCRNLGWEICTNKQGKRKFWNSKMNYYADIYKVDIGNEESVYIPISDESNVTLAYNLHNSSSGNYCYLEPNEWIELGMKYKKSRRRSKNKHYTTPQSQSKTEQPKLL